MVRWQSRYDAADAVPGLRALVDQRQTLFGHQTTDTMAPDTSRAAQMPHDLPRAVPRRLQELLVERRSNRGVSSLLHRRLTVA